MILRNSKPLHAILYKIVLYTMSPKKTVAARANLITQYGNVDLFMDMWNNLHY